MAAATRQTMRGSTFPGLFSFRIFIFAMFSLLSIATLSVLFANNPPTSQNVSVLPTTGNAYVHRTFLALKSDPLRTRVDLIHQQAKDHIALVNAYGAYARKLKLDISKQLETFGEWVHNFSHIAMKPVYQKSLFERDCPIHEDALKLFEREVKERVKSARMMFVEATENYVNHLQIQKLKDTIFAVHELLAKAKKNGGTARLFSARSIPKSLHCLAMRLSAEKISNPEKYRDEAPQPESEDPTLYHYVTFSDNAIAVSVVVRSVVKNAVETWKHVIHVVANRLNVGAMKVWFKMRPIEGGAFLEVKAVEEFAFLNSSHVAILRQLKSTKTNHPDDATNNSNMIDAKSLSMMDHLRFYLPEMYPKLYKILLLDEDVVVQKDLTGLWNIDMEGKVNGAVEICFGSFHRYAHYMNFSHPLIKEKFNPKACPWAYGINLFNLDAWRR